MEDGVEGAVAPGTLSLRHGGDGGAAEACAAEACAAGMRAREAAGPFRPTKTELNRCAHNSMKGRARASRGHSGITLL